MPVLLPRERALLVCVCVALVVVVVLSVRAARRAGTTPRDEDAPAATPALTMHNFVHPDKRELYAPKSVPIVSGDVWAYNVGNLGFTRHVRAFSSWYTPGDQAAKPGSAPMGVYSVQLYANGTLNNLSLAVTNYTATRGLTAVLFASLRIAAFRGENAGGVGPLGPYASVWVHRFPVNVNLRKNGPEWVLTIPSTGNIAQDMPALAVQRKHISALASIGDKDVPATLTDATRGQIEAVVPLAFNASATRFWSRHIRIHTPMFSQFAGGQQELSSLVDVYNGVARAVTPTTRIVVGANGGALHMNQAQYKGIAVSLQKSFDKVKPAMRVKVTPADLYEMVWVAKNSVSSNNDGTFVVLNTPGIGTCKDVIKYGNGRTAETVERYSMNENELVSQWSKPHGWDNGVFVLESDVPEDEVWKTFKAPGFADTMPWRWKAAPTREDALLVCM